MALCEAHALHVVAKRCIHMVCLSFDAGVHLLHHGSLFLQHCAVWTWSAAGTTTLAGDSVTTTTSDRVTATGPTATATRIPSTAVSAIFRDAPHERAGRADQSGKMEELLEFLKEYRKDSVSWKGGDLLPHGLQVTSWRSRV